MLVTTSVGAQDHARGAVLLRMRVDTLAYDRQNGWSASPLPADPESELLVFVFGAPSFLDDPRAIEHVVRAYPKATIVGCSTAGEIRGTHIHDESLSVAVVHLQKTSVRVASTSVTTLADSKGAGIALASELQRPDLRAVFVLSDGISVNGTELLKGIHSVLPPSVVVTGGLAADGSQFKRTWVLVDGVPTEKKVTAVGLYGDAIRVRHGSQGGWDIFGPERTVTRSSGSILYELDGQPALRLYKDYLGERAVGLPATGLLFPLALRVDGDGDRMLVRTILAVDEAAESMTFAGDIPEGARVQLMRANFDRLIDGAGDAGRAARASEGHESLAIAISCVGRRLVLGERTEEEVEATAFSLSPTTSLVGFYSYGEVCPIGVGEIGDLHNQTMTVTSLWEV